VSKSHQLESSRALTFGILIQNFTLLSILCNFLYKRLQMCSYTKYNAPPRWWWLKGKRDEFVGDAPGLTRAQSTFEEDLTNARQIASFGTLA
jgi:hypothetical protein